MNRLALMLLALVTTKTQMLTVEKCEREIVVAELDVKPSCYIDTRVRDRGTLYAPCQEGSAEALFGNQRFLGTVRGGELRLISRTEFVFDDGCTWVSEQTLEGRMKKGQLKFRYSERPVKGTGCLPACTASGVLTVACGTGACGCGGGCTDEGSPSTEGSDPVSASGGAGVSSGAAP